MHFVRGKSKKRNSTAANCSKENNFPSFFWTEGKELFNSNANIMFNGWQNIHKVWADMYRVNDPSSCGRWFFCLLLWLSYNVTFVPSHRMKCIYFRRSKCLSLYAIPRCNIKGSFVNNLLNKNPLGIKWNCTKWSSKCWLYEADFFRKTTIVQWSRIVSL